MTRYRVVMHKHYDLDKRVRCVRFTVERKGWLFWSTVQAYSPDGQCGYDRVFNSEEAATAFIEALMPYESVVLREYDLSRARGEQ